MTDWLAQNWHIDAKGGAKRKTARFTCDNEWDAQAALPVKMAPGVVHVVRDHAIRIDAGCCEWGCCDLRGTLTADKAEWFKRLAREQSQHP